MNRGQTPKAIARNVKETQESKPKNFALARAWLEAKQRKDATRKGADKDNGSTNKQNRTD